MRVIAKCFHKSGHCIRQFKSIGASLQGTSLQDVLWRNGAACHIRMHRKVAGRQGIQTASVDTGLEKFCREGQMGDRMITLLVLIPLPVALVFLTPEPRDPCHALHS